MSSTGNTTRRLSAGLALALTALLAPAQATSVKDLTLTELVAEATSIVRVKVTRRQASWGQHLGQPAIVSEHQLSSAHEPLLGEPLSELTLFGGEVGEERQTLEGQPELIPGREYLLLLTQARPVQCPLVGIWKGVFELRRGQVFQEGRPVVDVVGDKVLLGKDNERGMSPAALEAELRARLAALKAARAKEEAQQAESQGARDEAPTAEEEAK